MKKMNVFAKIRFWDERAIASSCLYNNPLLPSPKKSVEVQQSKEVIKTHIFDNMISLIEDNIAEVKEICEKHAVAALYLYGSALTDEFKEDSDLDFAVLFQNNLSPLKKGDAYFGLLEELENLFGRKIDLISYCVVKNPIFKEELDRTKMTLYAAA